MKMLLIDTELDTPKVIDIPDKLDEYYKHLRCSTIDITMRKVGGRQFDIICDDEGLFTEHPIVTAMYRNFEPALVGNLIFAHHNSEGEMTALSDEDVEIIKQNTITTYDFDAMEAHSIVMLD